MWYNPATWTPVDYLQGQNNQQQTTNSQMPNGAMYYNESTGGVEEHSNGQWQPYDASQNIREASPINTPAPDPYARWGGASNYNRMRNNYGLTQGGYDSSARTGMTDITNQYRTSNQSLFNKSSDTQNAINEGRINNALSLRRTMQTIINGVRQGLRSGGVQLANMNALDSGASEAMARAIAVQGNAQGENANAQWQTQEDTLNNQQTTLNRDLTEGRNNLSIWKDTESNRVRSDTFNKLTALKADADANGIDIVNTGLADQIVNEGLNALKAIDDATNWGSIAGLDANTVTQRAVQRDVEGRGAPIFSVSGDNVMNRQGAVTTSQMPFFVRRGRTGQTA